MILVTTITNTALLNVVKEHPTCLSDSFVAEPTESSLGEMLKAIRDSYRTEQILLIVNPELEEFAKTLGVEEMYVYDGDNLCDIEAALLYRGSPAVHRLVDGLKKEINRAKESASDSEALTDKIKEIEDLQNQLIQVNAELGARDKRVRELEDDTMRLNASIEDMVRTQSKDSVEQGAKRAEEDEKRFKEIAELKAKVEELTNERATEADKNSRALQSRDEIIDNLQTALETAKTELELARANANNNAGGGVDDEIYAKLQKDYVEAQQELVKLRGEVDSLTSELAGTNVTIEALQSQKALNESKVAAANARAESANKALEDVRKNIGSTSDELVRLRAENAQLQQQVDYMKEKSALDDEDDSNDFVRNLSLGLEKYTGKAQIIGVFGYGSSYCVANLSASIANSLGLLSDVVVIDLDPMYSSMNGLYGKTRFTAVLDVDGEKKKYPYVSALNDHRLFAAGLTIVKQNKSGSVSFGGGCPNGIVKLNPDRFVEELNGLGNTSSCIVLNLGCITPDLYPVLKEVNLVGKLICTTEGAKPPVKIIASQLLANSINVTDVAWVLSYTTPISDMTLGGVLEGANVFAVEETQLISRMNTLEVGYYNKTFNAFAQNLIL